MKQVGELTWTRKSITKKPIEKRFKLAISILQTTSLIVGGVRLAFDIIVGTLFLIATINGTLPLAGPLVSGKKERQNVVKVSISCPGTLRPASLHSPSGRCLQLSALSLRWHNNTGADCHRSTNVSRLAFSRYFSTASNVRRQAHSILRFGKDAQITPKDLSGGDFTSTALHSIAYILLGGFSAYFAFVHIDCVAYLKEANHPRHQIPHNYIPHHYIAIARPYYAQWMFIECLCHSKTYTVNIAFSERAFSELRI